MFKKISRHDHEGYWWSNSTCECLECMRRWTTWLQQWWRMARPWSCNTNLWNIGSFRSVRNSAYIFAILSCTAFHFAHTRGYTRHVIFLHSRANNNGIHQCTQWYSRCSLLPSKELLSNENYRWRGCAVTGTAHDGDVQLITRILEQLRHNKDPPQWTHAARTWKDGWGANGRRRPNKLYLPFRIRLTPIVVSDRIFGMGDGHFMMAYMPEFWYQYPEPHTTTALHTGGPMDMESGLATSTRPSLSSVSVGASHWIKQEPNWTPAHARGASGQGTWTGRVHISVYVGACQFNPLKFIFYIISSKCRFEAPPHKWCIHHRDPNGSPDQMCTAWILLSMCRLRPVSGRWWREFFFLIFEGALFLESKWPQETCGRHDCIGKARGLHFANDTAIATRVCPPYRPATFFVLASAHIIPYPVTPSCADLLLMYLYQLFIIWQLSHISLRPNEFSGFFTTPSLDHLSPVSWSLLCVHYCWHHPWQENCQCFLRRPLWTICRQRTIWKMMTLQKICSLLIVHLHACCSLRGRRHHHQHFSKMHYERSDKPVLQKVIASTFSNGITSLFFDGSDFCREVDLAWFFECHRQFPCDVLKLMFVKSSWRQSSSLSPFTFIQFAQRFPE